MMPNDREKNRAHVRRMQTELAIAEADAKKLTRESLAIDQTLRRIKKEQAMLQAECSVQEKKKSDTERKLTLLTIELKRLKKTISNLS